MNFPSLGKIVRMDDRINALIPADAVIETLSSGFDWTEGPVWVNSADGGFLLFSDIPRNSVMKWVEGKGASLVLVQYKDREVSKTQTARIVFYAPDPKAVIAKGVEMGATIVREPTEVASLNTVIGIMRDLDGYAVEVILRKD